MRLPGLDDISHHYAAEARGIEPRSAQRFPDDACAELGGRCAFQRAVIGSDRGANGVTQDDLSRWHGNVLRSVRLSVQDLQIPPDAHYRGIFRLRGHGEAHGTRKSQHRLVSCKNNAHCLAYPRGPRVLEQRRE